MSMRLRDEDEATTAAVTTDGDTDGVDTADSGASKKKKRGKKQQQRRSSGGRKPARSGPLRLGLPAEDDDDAADSHGLAVVNSTTCLVDRPLVRDDEEDEDEEADDSPPMSRENSISRRRLSNPKRRSISGNNMTASNARAAATTRPGSYTLPVRVTKEGKFRYLKPEEIESGRAPPYDFAVIVNRSVTEPGLLMQWFQTICCCGAGPAADGVSGANVASSQERRGFRRLCNPASTVPRESEDEQRRIVDQLCGQGLLVDIIDGGHSKGEMNSEFFILLIHAPDEVVNAYVTHFRDNLWMEHGAIVDLEQDLVDRSAPPTPAERVQIVDYIIEQRANLSTEDIWIHDMFPMHDKQVTDRLMTKWIASWHLFKMNDKKILKSLRHNFGEKVAYYFAFIDYYNRSLIPLAIAGLVFQLLHSLVPTETYMRLLPFWGIGVSVIWSFSFLKSWDRKNAAMQYEWSKKLNPKQIEYPNKLFYGEERVNSLTGEVELVYPMWRRLPKYLCVALFMLLQTVIMLVLVAVWVTIYEILKAKYPEGHIFSTQWFLILLEGMVFGIFVDVIQWNIVVTKMGALFTHWENYRTEEQYEKALIRKLFLLDFLNYYTWFFSLAFVFVIPGFGDYLMNSLNHGFFGDAMNCCFGPYVDQHGKCISCPLGPKDDTCIECVGFFTFDRHHVDLSAMFVTPIVVTQSLNIALQVIAPVLVRKRREHARASADAAAQERVMEAGGMKILGSLDYEGKKSSHFGNKSHARYLEHTPAQIEVLNKKAREILFESEQDAYDPYNDFHALTVQYGFTVMFSILWPLMPFACFMINSLKRRTDGYRLCKTLKRPIPRKTNGIGGWRGVLTVYAYVAVIVNVLLICISTGSLEFFEPVCVRDIEHQLEKQGKTLDDFIFGPDFGCLHISWRLLVILVLEHVLICGAYLMMTRYPRVPNWITMLMNARERRFKEILRTHESVIFPPSSSAGSTGRAPDSKSANDARKSVTGTGGFVDLSNSSGGGVLSSLRERLSSSRSSIPAISIDIEAVTPLSEQSESDLEVPSSNGFRTKGREQLARQWMDEE
ncbi:hypothetical protein Poli38472_008349 [Pythium oligandrum]|uniref:Anoctamin transmembrane domain-containing protein n=1 Tax=Pythium oligandrum TaxID=41045 RepID=A0A8K1CLI6_PYTOL|nr:hypothetical protein Poli38472_008349 [Pythium oligandrum]|eukprot:TMW65707.1 hypothetical protein Poli38472_008349 [Pythium oligandrum]